MLQMAQYANPNQFGAPMQDGEEGYMAQDEEWEREGLLDPAWEKQQRKVSFKSRNLIQCEIWVMLILKWFIFSKENATHPLYYAISGNKLYFLRFSIYI